MWELARLGWLQEQEQDDLHQVSLANLIAGCNERLPGLCLQYKLLCLFKKF